MIDILSVWMSQSGLKSVVTLNLQLLVAKVHKIIAKIMIRGQKVKLFQLTFGCVAEVEESRKNPVSSCILCFLDFYLYKLNDEY